MPNTAKLPSGSKSVRTKKVAAKKLPSKSKSPEVTAIDLGKATPTEALKAVKELIAVARTEMRKAEAKAVFTAPNPNTRKDTSFREVAKSKLEFALGRKVKVIKVVDHRGNVDCVLKGKIKELTTAGAFVSNHEKPNARPEWFPFKSKMQWLVLG